MFGYLPAPPPVQGPLVASIRGPNVEPRQVSFKLRQGTVTVYLPNLIREGDTISGAVFASTSGNWSTQHNNIDYLLKLALYVDGKKVPLSEAVFTETVESQSMTLELENGNGNVLDRQEIPLEEDAELPDSLPRVVQAGKPIGVRGDFDGDRQNGRASFGGRPIGILAEGAQECYVTTPGDRLGMHQLTVEDGGRTVSQPVTVVSISVLAPGKPTDSGETTSIGVDVEGLDGAVPDIFPVTVELSVDNQAVVRFTGGTGARGTLLLTREDLVRGHILKSVPIEARRGGAYSVACRVF